MSMHPSVNYFEKCKGDCDCWVESGSYHGDGITLAIQAGFTEIHSVDILNQLPANYKHGLKDIYLYTGDSATVFSGLLTKLKDRRIMFWLDGHSQMFEGEEENFPLMRELEEIRKSGIMDATILIDDFLFMTHPDIVSWNKDELLYGLKRINPNYQITYLSNPIKNNILLAKI